MQSLIYSIPGRYGLNQENFFWHRALVVFYVGDHQDHDQVIQLAINNNSGIREVVERVGGRYTHVSQSMRKEDFLEKLGEVLVRIRDCDKTEITKIKFNARRGLVYTRLNLPLFLLPFLFYISDIFVWSWYTIVFSAKFLKTLFLFVTNSIKKIFIYALRL